MGKLVLANASIVDVPSGDIKERATLEIDGDRISDIQYKAHSVDRTARVFDLEGAYVVPGLWNVHTHLGGLFPNTRDEHHESIADRTVRAGHNLMTAMARGITGIRVVGEAAGVDIAWRDAFRRGQILGPNLFVCGEPIVPTGGHGHDFPGALKADGPMEFRKAVRSQLARGVDQIKLLITGGVATPGEELGEAQALSDEISAAVEVAHRKGKRVTVHAGGAESVKEAVRLGVDCIEHGYQLDEEAAVMMAENGTYFVPTLFVTQYEGFLNHKGMAKHAVEKVREGAPAHAKAFQSALKAGVKIAAGPDFNPISDTSFVEIEMLVKCGMSPLQAITAATVVSAELCDFSEQSGSIDPGKLADMVVVPGNPLENVHELRNARLVLRAGQIVGGSLASSQRHRLAWPFIGPLE